MNKKIFSYLIPAAIAVAGLSSCSEEQTLAVGEGTMFISTRFNSDVVVESRTQTEEELAASTKLWIYSDEGVVRKYNGLSELPATGLKLISGTYTIKAWAGTLSYASFDDRWFEGNETVTIESGKTQAVEVVCHIANVVASVSYPDDIDEHISDYSMVISHKGGSLTFDGNQPDLKGYYIMPDDVNTLDYALTFTTDGQQKTVYGTIADVEPTHHYVLNVVANPNRDEMDGAAFITIVVEDIPDPIEDEIVITTPPAITGYGFDINAPVAGENGTIGRKSVYISAASAVKSLELSGIPNLPGLEGIEFIRATQDYRDQFSAAGIFYEVEQKDAATGAQLIKLVFEDTYLNALPNSEEPYVITISATDSGNKTTTAKLTLRISEAPVATGSVADGAVSYLSATLSGTIAKDGVESVGFEYAPVGSDEWQYVEGATSRAAFAKGQSYYATVTGLELSTAYKYRAVANYGTESAYSGDEATFTTLTAPQLPNASFENWHIGGSGNVAGKVQIPMPSGQEFWDSGNHGSATMNVNITNKVSTYKHSGSSCAQLRSQFVGIFGIGAFAAGNVFIGKYLETDGTNGIVGFGRPFDFPTSDIKPVAIKLWVKYETNTDWTDKTWPEDLGTRPAKDEGHIFAALFDDYDYNGSDEQYKGKYGFVVHTNRSNHWRLFDSHASNVIAYGEKVFTDNTPGSDLIELTIPFEYYRDAQPKLIAVTCTASKYGDYFVGCEGATMWVDDVEIVYGPK
ncbi:MAG: DUF4493 domain-containing protein [Bacteroides sp.]|nr:DUF4493 domain-containing protein [Bacteroides sp.]MCM1379714.1 DUF4493 domain-containing protein [Bacteroides sp.]MCM1446069.1 DUF4493 domain-containing protein [Prevotella sp.]